MGHFTTTIRWLVILAVAESVRQDTHSSIGQEALLRCTAEALPGVLYRFVVWYKVDQSSQQLTGLLRKRLTVNNSTVETFNGLEREIQLFENTMDLLLPNVTLEDKGVYRCFLSAPLGHRNQHGETFLHVYEAHTADHMERNGVNIMGKMEIGAIAALFMGLIMFAISYMCLRKVNQKKKKLISLKMPYESKNYVPVGLVVCKT